LHLDKNTFQIENFDQTGQKLSAWAASELGTVSRDGTNGSYVQWMAMDEEGNLYLSDNQTIWLYKQNGEYYGKIEPSGDITSMVTGRDGSVSILYHQSNIQWLAELDFESKSIDKTYDAFKDGSTGKLSAGVDADLFYHDIEGLLAYDVSTQKVTKILDWIDADIDASSLQQVTKLADGSIVAANIVWGADMMVTELITLTKTPVSELPDKEIIVIGCLIEDSNLNEPVAIFNRESDKYKIEVKTYLKMTSNGINRDEIADAVAIMNSEIAAGHAPDILEIGSPNIDWDSYAEKDVFVDLNEMFGKSSLLQKEDIVDSVIRAYTFDGKLIGLPTIFSIQTLYGKTSDVGNEPSWTIEELKEFMDAHPNRTILQYATKESMLSMFTSFYADAFIDWESGICHFDGDSFKEILELANRFLDEVDMDASTDDEPLLGQTEIYEFDGYQAILAKAHEPINFIGYPTPDGRNGSGLVAPNGVFTITAQSKHKEGAWAFLETLLTKEDEWSTTFSVYKDELERRLEKVKIGKYIYDENSEPVTDENGVLEQLPRYSIRYGQGEAIDLYAATQEEIDGIYALIDSAVGTVSQSDDIMTIILEEAKAYFNGNKTLDQVADIIQNRAQTYVSENM
jgi:ABC-type glycerol-3-phosphate transport system substrate-binding protein